MRRAALKAGEALQGSANPMGWDGQQVARRLASADECRSSLFAVGPHGHKLV